jgi:hypothetical protein
LVASRSRAAAQAWRFRRKQLRDVSLAERRYMPEWYEVCRYYQREVDFSRPAIVLGAVPEYQPFMEDWRGGYVAIAHPKCFAEREGDDELLDTVARNDLRQRGVRKASTSCAFSLWSGLLSTGAVWAVGSLSRAGCSFPPSGLPTCACHPDPRTQDDSIGSIEFRCRGGD